jgi:beta-lactamase regulating signal transducer with metallopeptidase domain
LTPSDLGASAPAGDATPKFKASSATATNHAAATVADPLSWKALAMLAWAAIVLLLVLRIVWQGARLGRVLSRAAPADAQTLAAVANGAARIGLRRVPRVHVLDLETSPFVCGVARPCLVLPRSLAEQIDRPELEPVLLHELAHLKRRDLWWCWLPQLAATLYWFHPLVYWVTFRTRLEAELACDGYAMATSGRGAGEYADLLVRLMSHFSQPDYLRGAAAASAGLDGQAAQAADTMTSPTSTRGQ